jgi:alkanesulfonate monooxygenase SsuD/methylene tetrahydromethanopterin reductase-like flavin-dependent oxidoreductase (luciferase family)
MHVGIFVEERRRDTSEATALREALELAEAAETGGLDGVWLGEIHFAPGRSVQSAPFALAAFMAARTRRVRIGTAVTVLPLAHPLRIAEEVATVDQLSEGRFDFGIGRSGLVRTYEVLGIPYAESQARFEEALLIMRQAWKGEPFAHQGKFYRFDTTTVAPRPYQQPHPPLRMAANSPETFALVGRAGLSLFAGLRSLSIPELRAHVKEYRAAWRAAGHAGDGDVCLRIPVYAAPTEKAAREEPYENTTYFFKRNFELARARGAQPAALSYDDILDTRVAYGTAGSLKERLGHLRDELGLDGIIAELNPGGLLTIEQMRRTLGILTHEVLPALR